MESIGDKLRGLALAVGVHALAFALLFLGLSWTQAARPVSVPGPIIEATLASYTPPPTARIPVQKPQPPRPRPEAAKPVIPPPEIKPQRPEPPAPPRAVSNTICRPSRAKPGLIRRGPCSVKWF